MKIDSKVLMKRSHKMRFFNLNERSHIFCEMNFMENLCCLRFPEKNFLSVQCETYVVNAKCDRFVWFALGFRIAKDKTKRNSLSSSKAFRVNEFVAKLWNCIQAHSSASNYTI